MNKSKHGRFVIGTFQWDSNNVPGLELIMLVNPDAAVLATDKTKNLWHARKWNSRQAALKWLHDSNTPKPMNGYDWRVLNLDTLDAPL